MRASETGDHMNDRRKGQSGNVFFTLFGAVALVGVIGVATSTLMRGPVGTVVNLNQKAKAESQLQIARRLAALDAAQRSDADCDGDNTIEPTRADIGTAGCNGLLVGGGCLPLTVGAAKVDPWGTMVGYCAWDHAIGASPSAADYDGTGCGAVPATERQLLAGTTTGERPVLAVISAGPDRVFQTECNPHGHANPYAHKPGGSDDIVFEWTYEEVGTGLGGGLWSLKSGDDDVITTDRDLEVSTDATFTSGVNIAGSDPGAPARLSFGNNSLLLLPTQNNSGGCTLANDRMLRVFTDADNSARLLQICHFDGVSGTWNDIGGSGASTAFAHGADGNVQVSSGGQLYSTSAMNWDIAGGRLRIGGASWGTDMLEVGGSARTGSHMTVGGNIFAQDGTAANPSISFSNANTSGLFSGAGMVGTSVGGTERLRVDTTGIRVNGDARVENILYVSSHGIIGDNLNVQGVIFSSGGAQGEVIVNDDLIVSGTSLFNGRANFDADTTFDTSTYTSTAVNAPNFWVNGSADGTGAVANGNAGMSLFDTNGIELRANGSPRLRISSTGEIGVGSATTPSTALDVGGFLRLRAVGATPGGSCAGTPAGSISYASGDTLLVCSSDTTNWETIGTSGGGGGGGGSRWQIINGALVPQALWLNHNFAIGTVTPGSAATQLFFDRSNASFRAGEATGAQWTNRGAHSVAMGLDTEARNVASFAMGDTTTVTGDYGIALGRQAIAGGNNSVAIGLGTMTGTRPTVTGQRSFGIFMGDQGGVDLLETNKLLLAGGTMLIDPAVPASTALPMQPLALQVRGNIGAPQYCNENGVQCFTPSDVAGGVVGAPGNDRELIFNSNNRLWADPGLIFDTNNRLGVGVTAPESRLDVGGTLRMAFGGEACNAPAHEGMIHYHSVSDQFMICRNSTTGWEALVAGNLTAHAPLRGVQFNSGTQFWADNNFIYTATGELGVGVTAPATRLDIGGALRLSHSGEECNAAPHEGRIHYSSTNAQFFVCRTAAAGWEALAAGSSTAAGGNLREIQFNSGNTLAGVTGFNYTLAGDLEYGGMIGLGVSPPTARLDVAGAIRLGSAAETCAAPADHGRIRYNAPQFEICRDSGTGWEPLAAGTLAAHAPLRGVQFNSGTQFWADNNFIYTATGDLGVGTATPQTRLDVAGTLKLGYGGEACDANREGALYYSATTDRFYGCQTAGTWTELGGGAGIRFTSLADTPNSYTGAGQRLVRVNVAESALEFTNQLIPSVSGQPAPTGLRLNNLDDVTIAGTPADGNVLLYSASLSRWVAGVSSTGGVNFWSAGSADDIYYNSGTTPRVGIGNATPQTALHVTGIIRTSQGVQFEPVAGAQPPLGLRLDDLDNVTIAGTPTGGDVLLYSTTVNRWVPGVGGENFWIRGTGDNIYYSSGTTPRVGIGNNDPQQALHVTGMIRTSQGIQLDGIAIATPPVTMTQLWQENGSGQIYFNPATPRVGIGLNNPAAALDVDGDIQYTGTITDISDMRLKTDIVPLRDSGVMLDKLVQVQTYSFRMKDDPAGRIEYGVMAQELEEIFPLLVHTAQDANGTKSVNYIGLIAPLVEATRELKAENDNLRAEIAALRYERDEIKVALDDLARDVKGLKAHTGYGIGRAQAGGMMILLVLAAGAGVWAGRRKRKAA